MSPVSGTGTINRFDGVEEIVESCNKQVNTCVILVIVVGTIKLIGTNASTVFLETASSMQ